MKLSSQVFLAVVLLLTVFPSHAFSDNCPKVGQYSTYAGTMLPGRASEAWCGLDGTYDPGEQGNVENAKSWDSSADSLGSEWKLYGMTIDANSAVEINRSLNEYGTGTVTYRTDYDGGVFWLSRYGAWGDGTADYTGTLTSYAVVTTVSYSYGNLAGATSNINATGIFDDCRLKDAVVEFIIANAMLVWHPAWGGDPREGYPDYLCTTPLGELFEVCCVTLSFQPAVPVDQMSWGVLKSYYK